MLPLDLFSLGFELLNLAVVSKQLGHQSIAETVRDYLAPHGVEDSPERAFVFKALTGTARDFVPVEDVVAIMRLMEICSSCTVPAPVS